MAGTRPPLETASAESKASGRETRMDIFDHDETQYHPTAGERREAAGGEPCAHFSRTRFGDDARPPDQPGICRCGFSQLAHEGMPGINPATLRPFQAFAWETQ